MTFVVRVSQHIRQRSVGKEKMNPIFSQNDTSVAFSGSSNTDVTGGERFFSPLVFVLVIGGMIFSNDVRAAPPECNAPGWGQPKI